MRVASRERLKADMLMHQSRHSSTGKSERAGVITEDGGDGAEKARDSGDNERHAAGHATSERPPVDHEDGDHVDGDLNRAAEERAQIDAHGAGQMSGEERQSEVDERACKPERRRITAVALYTVSQNRRHRNSCS